MEYINKMENISIDTKNSTNNKHYKPRWQDPLKTTNLSTDRFKEVLHICLSQLQV